MLTHENCWCHGLYQEQEGKGYGNSLDNDVELRRILDIQRYTTENFRVLKIILSKVKRVDLQVIKEKQNVEENP